MTLASNLTAAWFERRLVDRFLAVSNAIVVGSGLRGGRTPYEIMHNFVRDDVAALDCGADDAWRDCPSSPLSCSSETCAASRASTCSSGHTLNWKWSRPWS